MNRQEINQKEFSWKAKDQRLINHDTRNQDIRNQKAMGQERRIADTLGNIVLEFDGFPKEQKKLYIMILGVIVFASLHLGLYFLYAPYFPILSIQLVYILVHVFLILMVERFKASYLKLAISLGFLLNLSLVSFIWFPLTTRYGLYFVMVPFMMYAMMDLSQNREMRYAIIVSSISLSLFFIFLWLPRDFYLYDLSQSGVNYISMSVVVPVSLLIFTHAFRRLVNHQHLKSVDESDPLTGLPCRRQFFKRGESFFLHAIEKHSTFSLLIIDIDFFSRINHTYGHDIGDQLLIEFSNRMNGAIRQYDYFTRQGGAEFALILNGTSKEIAEDVAERIRKSIATKHFEINQYIIHVTISVGGVQFNPAYYSFSRMVMDAEKALNVAKSNGRNESVFLDSILEQVIEEDAQEVIQEVIQEDIQEDEEMSFSI